MSLLSRIVCLERSHRPHLLLAAATYTAVINQDGPWWVGWVEEVPGVNAQERSRDALLASLRVVLREALEFNREEARQAAGPSFEELTDALLDFQGPTDLALFDSVQAVQNQDAAEH